MTVTGNKHKGKTFQHFFVLLEFQDDNRRETSKQRSTEIFFGKQWLFWMENNIESHIVQVTHVCYLEILQARNNQEKK